MHKYTITWKNLSCKFHIALCSNNAGSQKTMFYIMGKQQQTHTHTHTTHAHTQSGTLIHTQHKTIAYTCDCLVSCCTITPRPTLRRLKFLHKNQVMTYFANYTHVTWTAGDVETKQLSGRNGTLQRKHKKVIEKKFQLEFSRDWGILRGTLWDKCYNLSVLLRKHGEARTGRLQPS